MAGETDQGQTWQGWSLYELYRTKLDEQGVGSDKWEDIELTDQHAWCAMAKELG